MAFLDFHGFSHVFFVRNGEVPTETWPGNIKLTGVIGESPKKIHEVPLKGSIDMRLRKSQFWPSSESHTVVRNLLVY